MKLVRMVALMAAAFLGGCASYSSSESDDSLVLDRVRQHWLAENYDAAIESSKDLLSKEDSDMYSFVAQIYYARASLITRDYISRRNDFSEYLRLLQKAALLGNPYAPGMLRSECRWGVGGFLVKDLSKAKCWESVEDGQRSPSDCVYKIDSKDQIGER